jgi:hypothetical protein
MAKKTILAIVLIGLGAITGLLTAISFMESGGKAGITITAFLAAAGFIITGTILIFTRVLDQLVNPVLDEIDKDIEDDLQDIKSGRFTNTFWMIIITGIAAFVFSFFVFRFHKLEARWGSIPVAIPTILGVGALAIYLPTTRWFKNKSFHTPMGVFLIPVVGLILTLILGISTTENVRAVFSTRQQGVEYYPTEAVGFVVDEGLDFGGGIFDFVGSISSGDDSGLIFIVIFLIALVFILVLGSAMFPHFWLLSGSLILSLMALIAIRDLRLRTMTEEEQRKWREGEQKSEA